MLRVLHLHDSPGVQAAPHLLPLGLDLLVGSHHCKWDTGLEKDGLKHVKPTLEVSLQYPTGNFTEVRGDYLQDPRLLFEILILIRLGIRKVVNFDSVFIDLIQDLSSRARKHL